VKSTKTPNLTMMRSDEAAEAAKSLQLKGLELPKRPQHERPDLEDADITSLDDEQLTDLLVLYTAWSNWANVTLTIAEIDERCINRKVEIAEAFAMVRDWGGSSNDRVSVTKAERELDEEVQERKQKQLEAYAYRKLAAVELESIEQDRFAVSREITRRGGGDAKTRRADRFSR